MHSEQNMHPDEQEGNRRRTVGKQTKLMQWVYFWIKLTVKPTVMLIARTTTIHPSVPKFNLGLVLFPFSREVLNISGRTEHHINYTTWKRNLYRMCELKTCRRGGNLSLCFFFTRQQKIREFPIRHWAALVHTDMMTYLVFGLRVSPHAGPELCEYLLGNMVKKC